MVGAAQCRHDFGAAGAAVDPDQLAARRHDGADRFVGETQQALDHVALLALEHAHAGALGEQLAQLLLGHRLALELARADQPQHHARGAAERPDDGSGHAAQPAQQRREPDRDPLRAGEGELLGHELAQHEHREGDRDHDQREGELVGEGLEDMHTAEDRAEPARELRAAEAALEHADQGDADLHRGQEALRIGGEESSRAGRP